MTNKLKNNFIKISNILEEIITSDIAPEYYENEIEEHTLSHEENINFLRSRYGEEKFNMIMKEIEERVAAQNVSISAGCRLLYKKGKAFLEQSFEGLVFAHKTFYVGSLSSSEESEQHDKFYEAKLQVVATDLRVADQGEIVLNLRWLETSRIPEKAPRLECSFMGQKVDANWKSWNTEINAQQVIISSAGFSDETQPKAEDEENFVVCSSWSADDNLLVVEVRK